MLVIDFFVVWAEMPVAGVANDPLPPPMTNM